ncbi:MAG: IS4 family transposase, partial [Methanosphaera sp.]|nr:IS4 family transposase [Methanosphaera sp.]
MMSKLIVSKTLSNLRDIDEKYYIGENSFQYVKKLTPENVAGIILDNNGYNINSQTKHFIKRIEGDPFKKVSGSAFCQRRQQLSHELFIKENEELVSNVYEQLSNLHNYNGKTLLAMDTSVITLPNHPLTKEKYGVKSKIDAKNIIPRARISCITDTLTNMIVSSEITVKATGEPKIAINQINNLENILDLSGCIFIGDRAYDTVPMIINIIEHDSHFILRLKKSTFKKERKNLIGDDENVLINMNKYRLKNVEDPEMKEKYLKKGRLNLRIIRIPLEKSNNEDKEDEEYLITNLPRNIAPYKDFKELYHQRWTVETEFDRLKNIHEIENFQGRKELC